MIPSQATKTKVLNHIMLIMTISIFTILICLSSAHARSSTKFNNFYTITNNALDNDNETYKISILNTKVRKVLLSKTDESNNKTIYLSSNPFLIIKIKIENQSTNKNITHLSWSSPLNQESTSNFIAYDNLSEPYKLYYQYNTVAEKKLLSLSNNENQQETFSFNPFKQKLSHITFLHASNSIVDTLFIEAPNNKIEFLTLELSLSNLFDTNHKPLFQLTRSPSHHLYFSNSKTLIKKNITNKDIIKFKIPKEHIKIINN